MEHETKFRAEQYNELNRCWQAFYPTFSKPPADPDTKLPRDHAEDQTEKASTWDQKGVTVLNMFISIICLIMLFLPFQEPTNNNRDQVNLAMRDRIDQAIDDLLCQDGELRQRAQQHLRELAEDSELGRQAASQALLQIVADTGLLPARRESWHDCAALLAEWQVEAALPPIIAALARDPASAETARAVLIEFGQPAVPALAAALTDQADQADQIGASKRAQAAIVLAEIGGQAAREALARALLNETELTVRNLIIDLIGRDWQ